MTAPPPNDTTGSATWATRSQALAAAVLAAALVIGLAVILYRQARVGADIEIIRAEEAGSIYKVDLNRADAPELMLLPGVGEVRAQRVIAWRSEKGPFKSFEEFQEAAGIADKHMEEVRKVAVVGQPEGADR